MVSSHALLGGAEVARDIGDYKRVLQRIFTDKHFITSREYLTNHRYLREPRKQIEEPFRITASRLVSRDQRQAAGKRRDDALEHKDSDEKGEVESIENTTKPITRITIEEQGGAPKSSVFKRLAEKKRLL